MFFRVVIKRPPQHDPQQRQHAGEHERALPAERGVGEVDNRRRQHRANREADAGPTGGDWTFRFREPFADSFGVCRRGGGFRTAHKEAQDGQVQPATGTGMSDTGNGPQGGANHKAELQADDVDKPAAQRLEKGIGQLKSADNPRILFGGDAERDLQLRGDNPQRVTCDVVDGNAEQKKDQHPPA